MKKKTTDRTEEDKHAFHLLWDDLRRGIWEQDMGIVLSEEVKKINDSSKKKKKN